MKTSDLIPATALVLVLVGSAFSQRNATLGENAALRYWTAFGQLQDSSITDKQAKELNAILGGIAPYDDSKYKNLVEKNGPALETVARAVSLTQCDWGLDYKLGEDVQVDYVRKALALGRLNVLYAFHLLIANDKDRAVSTLVTGLRFSRDVANGGTLFATVAAKDLLVNHLRAVEFALQAAELSAAQRSILEKAIAQLGPYALDWQSAIQREMGVLRIHFNNNPESTSAPLKITSTYVEVLRTPSKLPALKESMNKAPRQVADLITNPSRVLEERQNLGDKLTQTRSLLR